MNLSRDQGKPRRPMQGLHRDAYWPSRGGVQSPDALSADLQLAACCCAWPPSPSSDERLRQTAARIEDWADFEAAVDRHRIAPLVHRGLTRAGVALPPGFADRLSERSRTAARQALSMARESLRLQRELEAAGIPSLVIKGVAMGMLAYGDVAAKEAWDLDLLVSAKNVARARDVLLGAGYALRLPADPGGDLERWVEQSYEATFVRQRDGLVVELHWKLLDDPTLMADVGVAGPAQEVILPVGKVRTLANEPLFAYLCLHGAFSGWSRLKWLAELHAFVRRQDEASLRRLIGSSRAFGAHRSASVALRLAQRLFKLPLPEAVAAELEDSRVVRSLVHGTLAALDRSGPAEFTPYSAEWFRLVATRLFLVPGARHVLNEVRFLWSSQTDRTRLALPPRWQFAYHFLRIPLWLVRAGPLLIGRLVRFARA
jgi:hypothetical protein